MRILRVRSSLLLAGVVAALLSLCAPQRASAAFLLELSDGTTTVTIQDDQVGDVTNTTPGQITFIGSVGAFTVNVTTGISKPLLPNTATSAQMHLNNVSISSATGGTLTIRLTDNNFSVLPGAGNTAILQSSFSTTTTSTSSTAVSAQQLIDLDNVSGFGGTPEVVISHGPVSGPGSAGEDKSQTFPYSGGPFSITEIVTITHTGGSQTTSFDLQSTVITPEPTSLALCLSAVPGALGAWWMRRKRQQKV